MNYFVFIAKQTEDETGSNTSPLHIPYHWKEFILCFVFHLQYHIECACMNTGFLSAEEQKLSSSI